MHLYFYFNHIYFIKGYFLNKFNLQSVIEELANELTFFYKGFQDFNIKPFEIYLAVTETFSNK